MPTLHVRNMPDDLYRRLQELADAEHRSLSAQVIVLLKEAVARAAAGREPLDAVLERIATRRASMSLPAQWPGAVQSVREDRER